MPLLKSNSKEAFGKNVEAEMKAGKSQKQAVAIAYSVKKNTADNPMNTSETLNTNPAHKLSNETISKLKIQTNQDNSQALGSYDCGMGHE